MKKIILVVLSIIVGLVIYFSLSSEVTHNLDIHVYAAREGVIYSFKENSNEGGLFRKNEEANYIIIKHSDGSFGCYWHLQKNGVAIKKGKVSKGQLIGYSGSTGFVLQPHLHFTVKRKLNYEKDSFVRTKFRTSSGVRLLEKGDICKKP